MAAKDDPAAHSVAVQLPTFNRLAPSSWFHLADANFHLRSISQSELKYWYVVSKLDPDTLKKLSSFLAAPRGKDPYAEIRSVLCLTYEPKREQKLDALLSLTELGDEHPAEFALELKRLLDNAGSEEILKRIFYRCLPRRLKDVVSGSQDDTFDGLAAAADRAWARDLAAEATVAAIHQTASGASVPGSGANPPARGRGRWQRGGRQPSAQQESRTVTLCPFHLKWGDGARRCLPTCSRWNPAGRQQVFHVEPESVNANTAPEN